ncbi:MAG: hypothetical protein PHN37_02680 [Candidatus Pacebacteria bacterium]|nr:hypothetical protein [Candidatus Paceibacterota bacterium]
MKNKYIFINLTILLSFLLFIPIIFAQAETYPTYVGLQIDRLYNPNVSSPTEWCSPAGGTMTVRYGEIALDTKTTITEFCVGDIIWSGLLDLDIGEAYEIDLSPRYLDSEICTEVGGEWLYGYCWICGDFGESCDQACGNVNTTCINPGNTDASITCSDISMICGVSDSGWCNRDTCNVNDSDCPNYRDTPWDPARGKKLTTGTYLCEVTTGGSYKRICSCEIELSYTFNFNAPAE